MTDTATKLTQPTSLRPDSDFHSPGAYAEQRRAAGTKSNELPADEAGNRLISAMLTNNGNDDGDSPPGKSR